MIESFYSLVQKLINVESPSPPPSPPLSSPSHPPSVPSPSLPPFSNQARLNAWKGHRLMHMREAAAQHHGINNTLPWYTDTISQLIKVSKQFAQNPHIHTLEHTYTD